MVPHLLGPLPNMAIALEVPFHLTEVRTDKGRTLSVRAYALEDFQGLVEMYKTFEPKRVAQGLPPPDVARIARWLDELQGKTAALIALAGERIVAHTVVCPISARKVEFCVFVHQDFREEGLGTAISQLTMDWAAAMDGEEVYLTTELSNFPALALFRKLGFQVTSSSGDECEMKLAIGLRLDFQSRAA